jgi:hypothetical protein
MGTGGHVRWTAGTLHADDGGVVETMGCADWLSAAVVHHPSASAKKTNANRSMYHNVIFRKDITTKFGTFSNHARPKKACFASACTTWALPH